MFVCSCVRLWRRRNAGVARCQSPSDAGRPPRSVDLARPGPLTLGRQPRPATAWTCGSGSWVTWNAALSGRRHEPILLLLPLDVASELLLDELEAELRHRGGILDRHAGPIGPVAADGHAELLGGPLGVGTERGDLDQRYAASVPGVVTVSPRHHGAAFCRAAPCIRRCAVLGRRRDAR
jgi:hypothetical protein